MEFMDAVPLSGVRITSDGYLVADARIARTGVQDYYGSEVGRPDLKGVRVYRPETEVFATDAMSSMAHRPVTNDHPAEAVTAANWKQHSVGMTGGEVAQDGAYLRVPMTVMDAAAITDIQAGKRELSVGYTCTLDWTPGVTPDGHAYDAIQKGIKANHLAVVRAGRAGSACRIGDRSNPNPNPTQPGGRTVALKTIIVDGLPIETTDAGEAAVNKLRGMLADAMAAMETATKKHTDAVAALMAAHAEGMAAKDKEMGAKDAAIEELNNKLIPDAKLDAMVADRASVLAKAKALVPTFDATGKSNADIRRAVVIAKLGDAKVKDKADAYVDGVFEALTIDVKADPMRDAIRHAAPPVTEMAARDAALAARKKRYETSYLNTLAA